MKLFDTIILQTLSRNGELVTRTLVKNATIVSVDDAVGVIDRGDLLIEDGIIVMIGADLNEPADELVDALDFIVIPGLVNAHIHLWQTAVRGLGVNWTGVEFHLHVQSDFVPAYTPEDIRLSEYVGAMSLIDGGTTSVLEWCHGNRTPEHSDAAIDGLLAAGIRGLFAHGTVKTLPTAGEPHFSQVPHPRPEATRLRERFGANDGRLRFGIGILGPDYSPIEVCRQDFQLARDLDVISTAHVSGHPGKVPRGYHQIAEEGLLQPLHNVVHANSMDDDQLRVLIDHGATATATPTGEVRGGAREPLIRRVIELGGRPSIGTDSEQSVAGDMLSATRDALTVQRLFNNLTAAETADPTKARASTNMVKRGMDVPPRRTPTTYDALRWATLDSAAALGIDHEVGSISVGKRADLVMIRKSDINLVPALNPVDSVVGFAHAGNVDSVMIDGEFVKRNGQLVQHRAAKDAATRMRDNGAALLHRLGLDGLKDSAYGDAFSRHA